MYQSCFYAIKKAVWSEQEQIQTQRDKYLMDDGKFQWQWAFIAEMWNVWNLIFRLSTNVNS